MTEIELFQVKSSYLSNFYLDPIPSLPKLFFLAFYALPSETLSQIWQFRRLAMSFYNSIDSVRVNNYNLDWLVSWNRERLFLFYVFFSLVFIGMTIAKPGSYIFGHAFFVCLLWQTLRLFFVIKTLKCYIGLMHPRTLSCRISKSKIYIFSCRWENKVNFTKTNVCVHETSLKRKFSKYLCFLGLGVTGRVIWC